MHDKHKTKKLIYKKREQRKVTYSTVARYH